LVFATSVVDAPHRIETPARLLFRGIPVRAVQSRPSRSEDRPRRFRTPLLGFIDRPSVDTTITASSPAWAVAQTSARDCHVPSMFRSCRSSRLQRFPPQRADPKTHSFDGPRVCCTPQPAMGFTTFRTPCSPSRKSPTRRSWTRRSAGSRPLWRIPYEAFPSSAASTMPSPRLVLSDAIAFTDWCSFSPFEPCPLPCRHGAPLFLVDLKAFFRRGVRCDARDVAAARPLDAPLGFGSNTFPDAAARIAPPSRAGRFAWRPEPLRRPPTRTSGEGRVFRPCLAPCDPGAAFPEGRTAQGHGGSGISRKSCLGRIPQRASKWVASGSAPRGGPPRRSQHPKAWGFRRHRDASPKRLVRDPALAPKSGDRWFELVLPILPRSPAYLMVRPLAADAHARRRARLRVTRAHPEGCCVEPRSENPDGLHHGASRRRHPEVGPWRLVTPTISSKLEVPAQGQTVVVFTRTAETRSEDEVSPPIRRSE
jgi:hypothetical protein